MESGIQNSTQKRRNNCCLFRVTSKCYVQRVVIFLCERVEDFSLYGISFELGFP
jgi:hypothetical protein